MIVYYELNGSAKDISQVDMLAFPPIVYYSIAGSIQIVVSVIAILLILEIFGKESKLMWFRIIIGLVVLELACNF